MNETSKFLGLVEKKVTKDNVYVSASDNKGTWAGKLKGMGRGQKYSKRTVHVFNVSDDGLSGTAKIQNKAVNLTRDKDGGEWSVGK